MVASDINRAQLSLKSWHVHIIHGNQLATNFSIIKSKAVLTCDSNSVENRIRYNYIINKIDSDSYCLGSNPSSAAKQQRFANVKVADLCLFLNWSQKK